MPTDGIAAARVYVKTLRALTGREITDAHIDDLCRLAPPASYERGEVVYREGDPAEGALLVVAGVLAASVKGATGDKPLGESRPGDVVGEAGIFLRGGHRRATLVALEPSVCLQVGRSVFLNGVGNPALHGLELHLLGLLTTRIANTDVAVASAWRETAAGGDHDQRLWRLLGGAR